MPLYMDVQAIDGGVTVDAVAHAHLADLRTPGRDDVHYLRYRVDEPNGTVFCLVADKVVQVQEGT